MLLHFIIKLTLSISICHFPLLLSSVNDPSKQLIIPPIIKEKSKLVKMLTRNKQEDFSKNPLIWPDGSLISQEHLNEFAKTYEPNFDYSQLESDELIATTQFHDHFQMKLPTKCLEQALYNNLKTHNFPKENLENLAPNWHSHLIPLLVQDRRLDVQLLQPYNDSLISQGKSIANSYKYTEERLLFSNDTTKIYGAYNSEWFIVVQGSPRFTNLLIKNHQNTIQKEIAIYDIQVGNDTYWFDDISEVHPSGLHAIGRYLDHSCTNTFFPLIDLTTQEISLLWNTLCITSHACCFSNDKIYTAGCNNAQQIIVKSIALESKQEKEIVTLANPLKEKIAGISINKDGNRIVVATKKTLFIIQNDNEKKKIQTITHDNLIKHDHDIVRISLNNSGTLLGIIIRGPGKNDWDTPAHAYLCNLTTNDIPWTNITQELKGNLYVSKEYDSRPAHLQKFQLTNIYTLQWNHDDSLLILDCSYRHQRFYKDGGLSSSGPIGDQYAFICPTTCNGWSEQTIRNGTSITNSADNEKTITETSGWFRQTKLLEWSDKNIRDALRYLHGKDSKSEKKFSATERLFELLLLNRILQNENISELDEDETKTYKYKLHDSIKSMLSKLRTVVLSEEKGSWKASLTKSLHILSMFKKSLYALSRGLVLFLATCYRRI